MFSQIDKLLWLKKETFMMGKGKNILDKSGFIDGYLEERKRKYSYEMLFFFINNSNRRF